MIQNIFFPYMQEGGWREKQRQRSSRLFGGHNLFHFLLRYHFASAIRKNRMNSTVFSKSTEAKQLPRLEIEQILSPFALASVPILLLYLHGCRLPVGEMSDAKNVCFAVYTNTRGFSAISLHLFKCF